MPILDITVSKWPSWGALMASGLWSVSFKRRCPLLDQPLVIYWYLSAVRQTPERNIIKLHARFSLSLSRVICIAHYNFRCIAYCIKSDRFASWKLDEDDVDEEIFGALYQRTKDAKCNKIRILAKIYRTITNQLIRLAGAELVQQMRGRKFVSLSMEKRATWFSGAERR